MANSINCDRDQAFLLPPELRDWLPENDFAHFVIADVECVDLWLFKISDHGSGKAQYHSWIVLAKETGLLKMGTVSINGTEQLDQCNVAGRKLNGGPDRACVDYFLTL